MLRIGTVIPLVLIVGAGAATLRANDIASTRAAETKEAPSRLGSAINAEMTKQQSELAARARQLEMRERLVEATARRMSEQAQREQAEAEQRAQSEKKKEAEAKRNVQQLVKVFQAMKPREAARIFEQLDIGIQVMVASRMRDRAVAAMLAAMTPAAATRLTTALALPPKPRAPNGSRAGQVG